MNKQRREKIRCAIQQLNNVYDIIDRCKDAEEDSLSNIEGTPLENTSRYEDLENSCEYLSDALESIDGAREKLQEAMYP